VPEWIYFINFAMPATERSMNSQPINGNGYGDRGYTIGQIAERRELFREVESLTRDDLVLRFCQDCLAQPAGASRLTACLWAVVECLLASLRG
jgi:hypothetical protein